MKNQRDSREERLLAEFEEMKALCTPYSLVDFRCADLSLEEGRALASHNVTRALLEEAWPGFLTAEQFEQHNPGIAPEKYLIRYTCTGLEKTTQDEIQQRDEHLMEVVFGWQFPRQRPSIFWLTPIWHPNFKGYYICLEGRPLGVGLTLAHIVTEVGRMIQYQNYNLLDPLNREARAWALQHQDAFPVDRRDILDSRQLISSRQEALVSLEEPLFELVDDEQGDQDEAGPLIELF